MSTLPSEDRADNVSSPVIYDLRHVLASRRYGSEAAARCHSYSYRARNLFRHHVLCSFIMGKMIGANYGKTTASAFTAAAMILSLRLPCHRCVRSHLTRCVCCCDRSAGGSSGANKPGHCGILFRRNWFCLIKRSPSGNTLPH